MMSTIRLTMPGAQQTTRQRSPGGSAAVTLGATPTPAMSAQVLKVMGSQPGNIPQIITLSSPRPATVRYHSRHCDVT